MDYKNMNAKEALKILRKVVPAERAAKSPRIKAELRKQRVSLEGVLVNAKSSAWDITNYAQQVLKGRFPAGEELLVRLVDPQDDYGPIVIANYAIKAVKGRWKEGEECIAADVDAWDKYLKFLKKVDKKALVEACKSRDMFAMWYAEKVAKGQWKPGEKAILKGKDWCSYYYAKAMGRRWEPGEKKIIKREDPATCFDYAKDVVKGRWEAGEKVIIKDTVLCYLYAKDIIKGRLPEHMHQAMVMRSFGDPNNIWVKKYLSSKKYNKYNRGQAK